MATYQVGSDIVLYWATGTAYADLVGHAFSSGSVTPIGCCNMMTYTVEENVEGYYGAGRRYPWAMKGGQIEVTVHIEGLWVDSGVQQFFENEAEVTGALTGFALGASGDDRGIVFSGCRMSTFDVEFDSEGWCSETIDIPAMLKV